MKYFADGWTKFLYDKFNNIYYHGLCLMVKEKQFLPEAKANYCINSLNEYLLQLEFCNKPTLKQNNNNEDQKNTCSKSKQNNNNKCKKNRLFQRKN